MRETYQSVVISIIASIILFTGILFYYFIYPKKKIPLLSLLLLLTLLPVVSVFRDGTYESGSLSDYVKFSYSFYESLKDGILIPRWDAYQCGGYGCPLFLYMYILPYYFISLFHFFGLTLIQSVKALLVLSYIGSGISMYYLGRKEFGEKAGFIASIFYLFAPYHLSDFHFSNDIGEMLAYAILPFAIITGINTFQINKKFWVVVFGISLALLLLSHHVIMLLSLPLLFGFIFFTQKKQTLRKKKPYFRLAIACLIGGMLSMFYFLPILLESKEILWGKYGTVSFINPINMFLYSPWRFGLLFQGPKGELSFAIGYTHLLLFFSAVFLLLKNKVPPMQKSIFIFLILMSIFYFFMLQPQSKILWEIIPLIKKSQLSYRLLIPISFSTAMLACLVLKKTNNTIVIIFSLLTIFSTILNWGNRRVIPQMNDNYLIYELKNREPVMEVIIPNWVPQAQAIVMKRQENHLETLSGDAAINEISRTTFHHEYLVLINSNQALLRENTFYYSGWKLFIDKKEHKIDFKKKNSEGRIVFDVAKGMHKIDLKFTNTPLRQFADIISLTSFIFLLLYLLFISKKTSRKKIKPQLQSS